MVLPSKKALSVFVLVTALVASVIIAFGRDKSSEAINYASNLVAGEKISLPENPNWQNEISELAGSINLKLEESEPPKDETLTDTVSRSLMSNYLALKQTGSLDGTSAQKLVDQTTNYVSSAVQTGTKTVSMNVVPDNGKQSIQEYGENLGKILKSKSVADMKKELDLITKTLQSEGDAKIDELNAVATSYKVITNRLLLMPVPKTFTKAHADMISGTNHLEFAFKEMANVPTDPLKGLTALQAYQTGTSVFSNAMNAVIAYIKQSGVIYEQGSGGYYLLYGI